MGAGKIKSPGKERRHLLIKNGVWWEKPKCTPRDGRGDKKILHPHHGGTAWGDGAGETKHPQGGRAKSPMMGKQGDRIPWEMTALGMGVRKSNPQEGDCIPLIENNGRGCEDQTPKRKATHGHNNPRHGPNPLWIQFRNRRGETKFPHSTRNNNFSQGNKSPTHAMFAFPQMVNKIPQINGEQLIPREQISHLWRDGAGDKSRNQIPIMGRSHEKK